MHEIMIARRPLIAARVRATAKSRETRQLPQEQSGRGGREGAATTRQWNRRCIAHILRFRRSRPAGCFQVPGVRNILVATLDDATGS